MSTPAFITWLVGFGALAAVACMGVFGFLGGYLS